MAINSPTTSARTLKTALSTCSHFFCTAVQVAFCDLLKNLFELTCVEELFASDWSFDPAFDLDPAEADHALELVQASVQRLRDLTPTSKGDKALKLAALLVHMATDLDKVLDRKGLYHRVAHARAALLLTADDPDAAIVNGLLKLAFAQIDRLAELEHGDMPLEPCDGPVACEAASDPMVCG